MPEQFKLDAATRNEWNKAAAAINVAAIEHDGAIIDLGADDFRAPVFPPGDERRTEVKRIQRRLRLKLERIRGGSIPHGWRSKWHPALLLTTIERFDVWLAERLDHAARTPVDVQWLRDIIADAERTLPELGLLGWRSSDEAGTVQTGLQRIEQLLAREEKPKLPEPPIPKQYLTGWGEVAAAAELVIKQKDIEEWGRKVLRWSKNHNGPIKPPGRGNKVRVEKTAFLVWWNELEHIDKEKRQHEVDISALPHDAHLFGKNGLQLVPSISGSIKKRRATKK